MEEARAPVAEQFCDAISTFDSNSSSVKSENLAYVKGIRESSKKV